MRPIKRRTIACIAIGGLTASLAACGGGSDEPTAPSGGSGSAPALATSGNISWWGWTPDTPVAQKYIDEFNKTYPDITVSYKNFENVDFRNSLGPALDSGQGPDVFDLAPAGGSPDTYGPYTVDLADFARAQLGEGWQSTFGGLYAKQLQDSDGKQTALPLGGMAAGTLWYDKEILDAAGVTTPPDDYDSWVSACKAVAATGKKCLAMGAGGTDTFPTEMFHSIANSVDPAWFVKAATGQAAWNDEQGIETLTIVQKMKADGIIAPNVLDSTQYPQADADFMKQDAAFVQMGYWYTQYSRADSCRAAMEGAGVSRPTCFTQLPTPFPDVAGKGNGSAYFGEADYGLAVNEDSPNIAAAKTFVNWLTMTKDGQQNVANALDLLPALNGVTPDFGAIELADQAAQQPAIEKLIEDSLASSQTRQWQVTTDTLHAIVVAIQQVLDPTSGRSIQQIADALQGSAVASSVGAEQ